MILYHEPPQLTVFANKDKSGYVSVEVHQNRDGVKLSDVIDVLRSHKKQDIIKEALRQGNVTIWVAVKQYMQMVGSVSPEQFEKLSKKQSKLTVCEKFDIAAIFKFYEEMVGLDEKQKKSFEKLKLSW